MLESRLSKLEREQSNGDTLEDLVYNKKRRGEVNLRKVNTDVDLTIAASSSAIKLDMQAVLHL